MKGRIRSYPFIINAFFIFAAACSTVPREVRQVAADVSFKKLSASTDEYTNRIVILGGYIERIEIQDDQTRLVVLQAPLGLFDHPKSRKKSEGRFLGIYDGLLGSEGYGIGQEITIVGTVLGKQAPGFSYYVNRIPAVEVLEIYRWYYMGEKDIYCDTPVNGENFPDYGRTKPGVPKRGIP